MHEWLSRLNTLIDQSGVTQQALAESAGIDRTTLYRYLTSKTDMPSTVLMAVLARIGADISDLQAPMNPSCMLFRSDTPGVLELPAIQKTIRRFAEYSWLEDELAGEPQHELSLPTKLITKKSGYEDEITELAQLTRAAFHPTEQGPIPTFIDTLQLSVKVLSFHMDGMPDGFSVKEEDWGVCTGLNIANRSVERTIFTAAHELGHVCCGHLMEETARTTSTKELEDVANYFAGVFLVPASTLRFCIKRLNPGHKPITMSLLRNLKDIFGMSYQCILKRLWQEHLISPELHRVWRASLYPHESIVEPDPLPQIRYEERLKVLAVQAYQQELIGVPKVAEMLDWSFNDAWEYLREAVMHD